MTKVDALVHGRWVVPVEPHDTVLENYTIVIDNGQIIDLLPQDQQQYHSATHYDRNHHVIIPGLINAHTHASMNLMRGMADDLPLMEWLNNYIWPTEQRFINEQFVKDGSRSAIAEMIRGGITCFNDMYFFPNVTAQIAQQCGIRAMIGLMAVDFATPWAQSPDEYLAKATQVHEQYQHDSLISTCLAPHAPYTVSEPLLMRILELANSWDCRIHIHLHETKDEVADSIKQYQVTPIARLAKLGFLSERIIAVHMVHLNSEDFQLIHDHKLHIAHCPESNLKLASGFSPTWQLHTLPCNIALGTDGAASNNDLDMLGEMRTCALLTKGLSNNPAALTSADVLRMATLNGAIALGIDNITGSLTKGKAADMVAIDLATIESTPMYNVISHLIYATSRSQVSDVWVAGRPLLLERNLTTLDADEIMTQANYWQDKLKT